MSRALDLRPLVLAALDGFSEEFYDRPFEQLPEAEQERMLGNLIQSAQRIELERRPFADTRHDSTVKRGNGNG